ncbi:MAG: hypothetical protein VKN33_11120 [Candidatus Sericytochromatia bacterium]|nr:hypothetical protein [Candidatus Sericytochromatia bacterium]
MAKSETEAQAMNQAVETVLGGLGLKRKQELIERNDRLRPQFLGTQKIAVGKAREGQINTFLSPLVAADKKIRALVFSAWLKDNLTSLGDVPEFSEVFKRDSDAATSPDEATLEAATKEATQAVKKWLKATDYELVNAFVRLGPYDFPTKVTTGVKPPKAKAGAEASPDGGQDAGSSAEVAGGVPESVVEDLRREMESQRIAAEAKLAKAEEEISKFKRLLEENKEKRKQELSEATEKSKSELQGKQQDWQRTEVQLRREIGELQKSRQDMADKTSKARDEIFPLKQQIERLEKEARRGTSQSQEARAEVSRLVDENQRLTERIKGLESLQQQLVQKDRQLQIMRQKGASVMLTTSDNLKIWEEALNEQEVKEAFRRTFNLDTIRVNHFEHDERDLHEVWKKLIAHEQGLVDRFFALPFEELTTPSDDFRELVTNFIELKDTLVAREQLAHMLNFVGDRFLNTLKQKV